jgi:hypothetical protein
MGNITKLLSFVPGILGVAAKAVARVGDGINVVSNMSKESPKASGIIAIALGWLGVDISVLGNVGGWISRIGEWISSLG